MNLDLLFYPKSVAIIGASDNLGGGKLPYFQILQANGFAGALYPVNPRRAEVCGVKAYASIDDLPGPVDFALVAAPVEQSIDIVKAAVRKGIKFIHFFTSGFGEILGLNDALVELNRCFGRPHAGIAEYHAGRINRLHHRRRAAFRWPLSEYLSTKSEETSKNPAKAALYTGVAYIFTVLAPHPALSAL